jgi:DNA-binding winged helix-turn-helix (wHTH) protein
MKSELDKALELEFAGFRLDPTGRQLTRLDGTPVKLNSRAFDTLLALVVRPGEILSKRSLHHAVWPDVVVGDNNLNQAIAAIRRALGDSDDRRRIIQTIPGRGFCFIADVQPVPSPHALTELVRRDVVVTVADYLQ